MNIRDICISLIINLSIISLIIISITGEGYIYGISLVRIMTYIAIPFSLINGLFLIRKGITIKNKIDLKKILVGLVNLVVSLYLFISLINNILLI